MKSPRILIIDDSITECMLMSNSLQQVGYEIGVANDGQEGLRRVMEEPPQCLILDVLLPKMNGYTVCRRIRTLDPRHTLPIIMVSGAKRTLLDQKYALDLGADRYLAKPFADDLLIQAVENLLPIAWRRFPTPRPQPVVTRTNVPEIYTLIPYRMHEIDIMRSQNPFARVPASDRRLYQLYSLIDGQSNVQEIAQKMSLDVKATVVVLKTLWQQQQIAFYDAQRKPFDRIPVFDDA